MRINRLVRCRKRKGRGKYQKRKLIRYKMIPRLSHSIPLKVVEVLFLTFYFQSSLGASTSQMSKTKTKKEIPDTKIDEVKKIPHSFYPSKVSKFYSCRFIFRVIRVRIYRPQQQQARILRYVSIPVNSLTNETLNFNYYSHLCRKMIS